MSKQRDFEQVWELMLSGQGPTLNRFRSIFARIPSSPRMPVHERAAAA